MTEPTHEDSFEYLDHTADVILHAWGDSLVQAFQNGVIGMFGYMTDLSLVESLERKVISCDFEADSRDVSEVDMLYRLLDECLYIFSTEDYFIFKEIEITRIDEHGFEAVVFGEPFDHSKHTQGTEIKAITFHGMQVLHGDGGRMDVHVLLDI